LQTTPNLGLKKYETNDTADLTAIGPNWDTLDQEVVKRIVNAGSVPSIQAGPDASKPAPGTAGRLYVATDTQIIYRDTGTAWVKVGAVKWGDIDGKPSSFTPSAHKSTHATGGSDVLTPADIGAETPAGAQAKADAAEADAKAYTDAHGTQKQTHGASGTYYLAKTSRSDQLPAWGDVQGKPDTFPPTVSSATPAAETIGATGTPGSSGDAARADHRHAMPTATDLLNAIKTVDGAGSGLDADTVDGKQASEFASASFVAGDYMLHSNPTEVRKTASSYTLVKQSKIAQGGTLRISFTMNASSTVQTAYGRVYRNGVPVGTERSVYGNTPVTFTEDISGWSPGDTVEVWGKATGSDVVIKDLVIKVGNGPFAIAIA
jgi:hypothetical protein